MIDRGQGLLPHMGRMITSRLVALQGATWQLRGRTRDRVRAPNARAWMCQQRLSQTAASRLSRVRSLAPACMALVTSCASDQPIPRPKSFRVSIQTRTSAMLASRILGIRSRSSNSCCRRGKWPHASSPRITLCVRTRRVGSSSANSALPPRKCSIQIEVSASTYMWTSMIRPATPAGLNRGSFAG